MTSSIVSYPVGFIAVVCICLASEVFVGFGFNLFSIIQARTADMQQKGSRQGNRFVATLKVVDLVLCVTAVPLTFASLIVRRENNLVVCFMRESSVMFSSTASSVCVLMISMDRYCAVIHPTRNIFTPTKVRLAKTLIWIAAGIGFVLPLLCLAMGQYASGKALSRSLLPCRHILWVFRPYYFYDMYYVVLFVVTVVTVIVCYTRVLRVAKRRINARVMLQLPGVMDPGSESEMKKRRQETKVTRVTLAVVVSFLMCWGPHFVVTLVQFGLPDSVVIDMCQLFCLVLAFLTPVMHPLIYTYERRDTARRVGLAMPMFMRNRSRKVHHHDDVSPSSAQAISTVAGEAGVSTSVS